MGILGQMDSVRNVWAVASSGSLARFRRCIFNSLSVLNTVSKAYLSCVDHRRHCDNVPHFNKHMLSFLKLRHINFSDYLLTLATQPILPYMIVLFPLTHYVWWDWPQHSMSTHFTRACCIEIKSLCTVFIKIEFSHGGQTHFSIQGCKLFF